MIISNSLLDKVSMQAMENPRLRMNYNLHVNLDNKVHRFFNAMEPGTLVSIHRHQYTAETFMLLRGKLRVVLFDDNRKAIEDTTLSNDSGNYGIHIPQGVWHWVEVLESNTVTFEVKEGPYKSLSKEDIKE